MRSSTILEQLLLDLAPQPTSFCIYCQTAKPLSAFGHPKSGKQKCKKCRAKYTRDLLKTPNAYIKNILARTKYRSKKKGFSYDLDYEFIKDALDSQEWRCSLSGIPFVIGEGKHRHSPSVDRIDSNKGYTKDNVRIIIDVLNTALGRLTDLEFINLAEMLKEEKQ